MKMPVPLLRRRLGTPQLWCPAKISRCQGRGAQQSARCVHLKRARESAEDAPPGVKSRLDTLLSLTDASLDSGENQTG
jgi:hypothetical protein